MNDPLQNGSVSSHLNGLGIIKADMSHQVVQATYIVRMLRSEAENVDVCLFAAL